MFPCHLLNGVAVCRNRTFCFAADFGSRIPRHVARMALETVLKGRICGYSERLPLLTVPNRFVLERYQHNRSALLRRGALSDRISSPRRSQRSQGNLFEVTSLYFALDGSKLRPIQARVCATVSAELGAENVESVAGAFTGFPANVV